MAGLNRLSPFRCPGLCSRYPYRCMCAHVCLYMQYGFLIFFLINDIGKKFLCRVPFSSISWKILTSNTFCLVCLGFCLDLFVLTLSPSLSSFSTNGKCSSWEWQLPNRGWETKKSACGTLQPMSVKIWFSSWREQRNRLSPTSVMSGGYVCTAGHDTEKSRLCPNFSETVECLERSQRRKEDAVWMHLLPLFSARFPSSLLHFCLPAGLLSYFGCHCSEHNEKPPP